MSDSSTPASTSASAQESEEPIVSLEPADPQCNPNNFFEPACNSFLLKREVMERSNLAKQEGANEYLYPTLNDAEFNIKIAEKKEFHDTKYEGPDFTKTIQEQADLLANADYELAPHQMFVKSFLSFETPYSSLLLYHGLGSGKTCSAIGVCEEMRDYMKQVGMTKRIIIVASENVQDNFKLQLFDERKLKEVNGIWSMRGCVGNKLLKEINPMNVPMSKEKIVSQIKNLINNYYIFLGYVQFANYIIKTINYDEEVQKQRERRKKGDPRKPRSPGKKTKIQELKDVKVELNNRIIRRIRNEFNNRLIVIDEVHNIRKSEENENKKVAVNLEYLVKAAENMRFLLLSATPMYNNYKEIIWLLNLMNTNDRRGRIEVADVFDKFGNFKKDGEDLLIRKATGYISFVRGENPYTFPYRVYPSEFSPENTFPKIEYPPYQMNLKRIKYEDKKVTRRQVLSLYLSKIGECKQCGKCQYCCYKYIIHYLRNKKFTITTKQGVTRNMPSFANMESFGYTMLQTPLESLIISYPAPTLKEVLDKLPAEKYSNDYSPSFDEETASTKEDKQKEDDVISPVDETAETIEEDALPATLDSETKAELESREDEDEEDEEKTSKTRKQLTIDPHQLTGKLGISRMMQFVDSKSPPVKGDYEYKASTIQQYGKIFSQAEIGKYSSKIKTILDFLYNPKTNHVSEGIVLIYSQYIDSGLVPVALALEEMGFTRFGKQGIKPLFKDRPSEVVDVRTMKPPVQRNDFMPARYSMITGDPRISPDNDYEVKGLTNDANKDGHKVKVVLISKAGSEGIDFKFIRQVHILEPWYNLNRIEQTIGRGVRNLSHKDLPFEKRNVQIFLHGTILDENVEEAADLYVYRVAEHKAKQIGKVTRVLKETAVDCIIHHDQTLFTQKTMAANMKEKITQELSTGQVLKDFKVGDAPFSPSCDYMEHCNYSCRPDGENIDPDHLNEDTYNETFIYMNSEKILQRIRMLFREAFFYKKNTLLNAVRHTKEYPYVQIYAALTQLIEDENEFLVDKYGRNGRLVNIGDYYLFQPLELNNKNASIFDRAVPLDYKHSMVKFDLKDLTVKKVGNHDETALQLEQEKGVAFPEGKLVLTQMQEQYALVKEYMEKAKVPRGDDNWFKYAGVVFLKLRELHPGVDFFYFLVAHMIETLLFEEKLHFMNHLYSLTSVEADSVEKHAKEYFHKHTILTPSYTVYIGYQLDKKKIMMLNEENVWVDATPQDIKDIARSAETIRYLDFDPANYNPVIGFMGYKKGNDNLLFKTKNLQSKRDAGARCDEAGKAKNITKLNEIVGRELYSANEYKAMNNTEICVLEEFILRHFDEAKHAGKHWFLTPELAIYHKLYTVAIPK